MNSINRNIIQAEVQVPPQNLIYVKDIKQQFLYWEDPINIHLLYEPITELLADIINNYNITKKNLDLIGLKKLLDNYKKKIFKKYIKYKK